MSLPVRPMTHGYLESSTPLTSPYHAHIPHTQDTSILIIFVYGLGGKETCIGENVIKIIQDYSRPDISVLKYKYFAVSV